MLADLVVLFDNLFDIKPAAIKDVGMTIVNGDVVFERK